MRIGFSQGYVGEPLFASFLTVIRACDRCIWDLFTISKKYLPTLLTSPAVVDWAKRYVRKLIGLSCKY